MAKVKVFLNVEPKDKKKWNNQASHYGVSLSEYLRTVILFGLDLAKEFQLDYDYYLSELEDLDTLSDMTSSTILSLQKENQELRAKLNSISKTCINQVLNSKN